MTPEREQLLAELLQEVVEQDKRWIPDAAYPWIQQLVCWAAVEVMIIDERGILLRHRENDRLGLNGWHIIGGYIKPGETTHQACERHAREDAGIGIKNLRMIGCQQWLDHPLGFPNSSLIICEPDGDVVEREDLKFFAKTPDSVIHPNHRIYLWLLFEIWLQRLPERSCYLLG